MDSISRAFVINFVIRELPKRFSPISSMIEIDGDLETSIHDNVVFSEKFIALGELVGQLNNWVIKTQNGILVDFAYSSMDYEESPVFSFTLVDDVVIFHSSWYPNLDKEVRLEHVVSGILRFLEEFRTQVPEFEIY